MWYEQLFDLLSVLGQLGLLFFFLFVKVFTLSSFILLFHADVK